MSDIKTIQNCNHGLNLSADEAEALARKFAPMVALHPDEDWLPSSVEWYLSRVTLCHENDRNVILNKGQVTPAALVNRSSDQNSNGIPTFDFDKFIWYLRIPDDDGDAIRRGQPLEDDRVVAPCYVHIRQAPTSNDVDIQYWFFYPYNGRTAIAVSTGTHDADWEHVTVRVDSARRHVKKVFYARHGGEGKWYEPDECVAYAYFRRVQKYDKGDSPCVAFLDSTTFLEVHDGSDNSLYLRIGVIDSVKNSIQWPTGEKGVKYDGGKRPAVAVASDGTILEVHHGAGNDSIYYRIGRLNPDRAGVTWTTGDGGKRYDKGDSPSVVFVNDNSFVEVHDNSNGALYYRIGTMNRERTSVDWLTGEGGIKYDGGNRPTVAVAQDGTILEVHHGSGNDSIWYRLGRLTEDLRKIVWTTGDRGVKYDGGDSPYVAFIDADNFIEVHDNTNDGLYYRVGRLNAQRDLVEWITGDKGIHYDGGKSPAIAATVNGTCLEVHHGSGSSAWNYGHICMTNLDGFPLVFSAVSSHASYSTFGFEGRGAMVGIAPDHTGWGAMWDLSQHMVLLKDSPLEDDANPWIRFAGHWGASKAKGGGAEAKSPDGPAFKGAWCSDS